jgi:hypothetical protein
VRPAIEAEKLGIPSVVITTTGFTAIARAVAKAEGLADLRIGEYPGAVGVHEDERVVRNVEDVLFGRIVKLLTEPAAAVASASVVAGPRGDAIVFEGDFDEVNAHFRSRLWTDELPIVPPTLERVNAFLAAQVGPQQFRAIPDSHLLPLLQRRAARRHPS